MFICKKGSKRASHQLQTNSGDEILCEFQRRRGTAHSEPESSRKEGFVEVGLQLGSYSAPSRKCAQVLTRVLEHISSGSGVWGKGKTFLWKEVGHWWKVQGLSLAPSCFPLFSCLPWVSSRLPHCFYQCDVTQAHETRQPWTEILKSWVSLDIPSFKVFSQAFGQSHTK